MKFKLPILTQFLLCLLMQQKAYAQQAEVFAQRVVNLNPIKYDAQPENNISGAATKHNEGIYDKASGNITINDVYTTTSYDYELKTQKEKRETIAVLSP